MKYLLWAFAIAGLVLLAVSAAQFAAMFNSL